MSVRKSLDAQREPMAGKQQSLICANLMGWVSEFDQVSMLEDQADPNFVHYFISST